MIKYFCFEPRVSARGSLIYHPKVKTSVKNTVRAAKILCRARPAPSVRYVSCVYVLARVCLDADILMRYRTDMKRNAMKQCEHEQCGKNFSAPRGGKFCSPRCRTAHSRTNKPTRPMSAVMHERLQTKKSHGDMVRCDGVTKDLTQCASQIYVNGTNRPGPKRDRYCTGSCRQRSYRLRQKNGATSNQQLYTIKQTSNSEMVDNES